MADSIKQQIHDSEEDFTNRTFWDIQPLFTLVRSGDVDTLKDHLTIRFEAFPEGRISANARKQREYLTVSLVNTFMIAAIQGGAYPPEANWIADRALVRLASFHDLSGIPELVSDAALQL